MKTDRDLASFVSRLESLGLLKRIGRPTSVLHEITEIHRRVLAAGGPALLFERPVSAAGQISSTPVLVNLFGTRERIALGLGVGTEGIGELAQTLAFLRNPEPPRGLSSALEKLPALKAGLPMGTKKVVRLRCHEQRQLGDEVDLSSLPIQWCWPRGARTTSHLAARDHPFPRRPC